MSYLIGKGRYARETYPEPPRSGSAPPPVSSVDLGMMFSPATALNFWQASGAPSTFVELQIDAAPFQYAGSVDLSLNGATGVLTYNGSDGRVALVSLISCGFVASAAVTNTYQAVSLNGDIVGTLVSAGVWIPAQGQNGMISNEDARLSSIWTCERRVLLNGGDTLRGTFASDFNPVRDIEISNLSMSVLLL